MKDEPTYFLAEMIVLVWILTLVYLAIGVLFSQ